MTDLASIERLNADCTCVTLDVEKLCQALEQVVGDSLFCRDMAKSHPHLLAAQPLFLSQPHADSMQELITAIETVAKLPSYQSTVLAYAPEVARYQSGAVGVFMGYDFHLGPDGPKLIEINTNAGGALINAYLLQAQRACCAEMGLAVAAHGDIKALLEDFVESFQSEWRTKNQQGPLRSIAIVDAAPSEQYLYPEFVLFQRLFEHHGITAVIAAPEQLEFRAAGLLRRQMLHKALRNAAAILPHASTANEIGGGLIAERGVCTMWRLLHRRHVLTLVGPSCRKANVAQQCGTPMWHSGPD